MCQSINVSSDQQIFFNQTIVSTDQCHQCVIRPTKFFFNPTNVSTDQYFNGHMCHLTNKIF